MPLAYLVPQGKPWECHWTSLSDPKVRLCRVKVNTKIVKKNEYISDGTGKHDILQFVKDITNCKKKTKL